MSNIMRDPYSIYNDGIDIRINGTPIPNKAINILLYMMLQPNKREELKTRLKDGRTSVLHSIDYISDERKKKLKDNEDEILIQLLTNTTK